MSKNDNARLQAAKDKLQAAKAAKAEPAGGTPAAWGEAPPQAAELLHLGPKGLHVLYAWLKDRGADPDRGGEPSAADFVNQFPDGAVILRGRDGAVYVCGHPDDFADMRAAHAKGYTLSFGTAQTIGNDRAVELSRADAAPAPRGRKGE